MNEEEEKYCRCHDIIFEPGEQPILQEERYNELDPMTWCNDDGSWRWGDTPGGVDRK